VSFLLDTNVLREPSRPKPDPGLEAWFRSRDEADLHVSVVSFGELRRGAALLPLGPKRSRIEKAHREALRFFARNLLDADLDVLIAWGELSARLKLIGVSPGMADELIGATALVHNLTLVTRNTRHFQHVGCRVFSPWTG
jgi:predicted nucleic acid-binding protein